MDSLAGRKLADIIGSLNAGVEALSPCRRLFITQPGLEPILRRRARGAGAQVLEGHEIVGHPAGRDRRHGDGDRRRRATRTAYARAEAIWSAPMARTARCASCSASRSTAAACSRTALRSISMPTFAPQLCGKPLSVIYINNPAFGGFFRLEKDCQSGFLVVNTVGDPKTNPECGQRRRGTPARQAPDRVRAHRRRCAGPAGEDHGLARWRATSDVARRFQDGRVSWPATPRI